MGRYKGVLGIGLLIIGLILGVNYHQNVSAGDVIFRSLGLPYWSNSENHSGLQYSALLGITLVIVGFFLAAVHFRTISYFKLKLLLFVVVYPFFTEQSLFLLKWNTSGPQAVAYIKQGSSCNYDTSEDALNVECTVKLNNYGKNTERVALSPKIEDIEGIELASEEITMPPHSHSAKGFFEFSLKVVIFNVIVLLP
ncbi:hypothetical protein [Bacillus paralicheniformis]|uniref:hypothetical protein n=1 Tax=Bacillus paralicheniformis TaxID=1648923 RepID=UPI00128E57E2|nr:hypothetical protein [Bacillus paralicheniformis]MPQ27445.1 hypothetical protein [Bacillus paralicheniformis]